MTKHQPEPVDGVGFLDEPKACALLRAPLAKVNAEELVTENEPWKNSVLGLLNAVIDTVLPGVRLCTVAHDPPSGKLGTLYLRTYPADDRPRDLATVLRQLADQVDNRQCGNRLVIAQDETRQCASRMWHQGECDYGGRDA